MPGYAEVFQRIEKKYRVDAAQRALLEAGLGAALAPDAYGRSRVTSLYLDTPDRALIDRSLEKPTYKEKLRLRAYGPEAGAALAAAFAPGAAPAAPRPAAAPSSPDPAAASSTPVFLEIKKKLRGVVYKRRVALSLGAAVAYLGGAPYGDACAAHPLADPTLQARSLSPRSRQIARELDAALARHGRLVPSMAIACERVAWAPADPDAPAAAGLRVTFDDRLAFLDLMAPALSWRPVIPPADAVMEVKSVGPYPRWLADLLAQARAYPASFSKYGTAYRLVTPPLKGGRCA
ncbi:polyphosphate polymerase domain-containing protein [Adlercreutzia faecimuris]|uniref:Polyphosphate polymerase domain-containing protein n=1 Tax=Adlercreutzia faecimuris TaxID=2897341 RepID=A0ABS9WD35_9ACTN|nr:polyphosphate polymerase domain-containing protein [Adlercreutzia sp. JBNU-10]MCI2240775.1 polyphosphate polymerase domain-containing protein [Adlercreutzia sp. JBNU-10]